jgi:hypothetical protein
MKLEVRRFEPRDAPGIARLNERLRAHDLRYTVYPEDPSRDGVEGRPVRTRLFVVAEGDEIRGAVWLKELQFWVSGEPVDAGWVTWPVAESLIDGAYSGVPGALMVKLLREQPQLLTLGGLGGQTGGFARLIAGMKWAGMDVPFRFRIVNPTRVLRRLTYARNSPRLRFVMDLLAYSGLGWVGHRLVHGAWALGAGRGGAGYRGEVVAWFGPWADEIWERGRARYGLLTRRDSGMLNFVYPDSFRRVTRVRVTRDGEDVGWIAVVRADLREAGHDAFGRLSVGLLADAFAEPEHARGVLAVGVRQLVESDVDLIFSNQSHPAWDAALKSLQFVRGPSNFFFYRAPKTEALLTARGVQAGGFYFNRGDCDGPVFW